MKKLLTLLLCAALLTALTACGTADKLSDAVADKIIESIQSGTNSGSTVDPAAAQKGAELAKDMGLTGSGWLAADSESTPYGQYRTVEEWEAIFSGEMAYDNAPAPVEAEPPAPVAIENAEDSYSGGTKTITFDENNLGQDTGVEIFDWKAEMSPEELAEYEEFENTDWDAMRAEMEAEMGGMEDIDDINDLTDMPNMDDVQSQLDEALKQAQKELEDAGLGDLDLGALMGGSGDLSGLLGGLF